MKLFLVGFMEDEMGFSVFKARICGISHGFAGFSKVEMGIAILCDLLVKTILN
jgi:hypothetical protein